MGLVCVRSSSGSPSLSLQVDVERVLHRARRMVLRVVERGEVVPVGLDLRAVGDRRSRSSAKIASIRCQVRMTGCTPPRPRPRPGSVTSSASSARRAASFASASSARRASSAGLDLLLCRVDTSRRTIFVPRAKATSGRPEQRGQLAGLAEEARLGVLEGRGIARRAERRERAGDDAAQFIQARPATQWAKAGFDLAGDLGERRLVEHREVGEHLAVDLDVGVLQARHERAVASSRARAPRR